MAEPCGQLALRTGHCFPGLSVQHDRQGICEEHIDLKRSRLTRERAHETNLRPKFSLLPAFSALAVSTELVRGIYDRLAPTLISPQGSHSTDAEVSLSRARDLVSLLRLDCSLITSSSLSFLWCLLALNAILFLLFIIFRPRLSIQTLQVTAVFFVYCG